MIGAVVLDAFGTIVRITQRTNPYLDLIRESQRQGRVSGSAALRLLMTTDLAFDEAAALLGVSLTSAKLGQLSQALAVELSSIQPFTDATEAISRLKSAGMKVGICSNLAAPYGPVIRRLFPGLDVYAFSYALGIMKPDPEIYRSVSSQMGIELGHYLSQDSASAVMIGDSKRCDQDGPRSIGMMGFHLDRKSRGSMSDLLQFADLVIAYNYPLDR
ncbi:HAD family hydrolase [Pseudomonas coronafaciens]|uniref:HAD family hydrolase n=1 Tax=Pseudomonas coronafaciens TaxID=53409 RepID=UPI0006D63C08|nr:HAD family hydrolase [Pseudomonas coronafaciens]